MASFGGDFLDQETLSSLGFASLGKGVLIHPSVIIIGLENLSIGDCSRIDAHTVILATARVAIGRNVHIAAGCYVAGGGTVEFGDFSGLSAGGRVYSINDDYSGGAMTGPTVPSAFTDVTRAPVIIGRHAIIGTGSVVFPGVSIGDGCALGALSLANRSTEPWGMYVGAPIRRIRERRRDALQVEERYLASLK